MSYSSKRLSEALASAHEIDFDNKSKFILFSDCHRGVNDWADDFAHNQNLYFSAINYYFDGGFTYIENGDGDELWENRKFSDIRSEYESIFSRLHSFYQENRLYMNYGNHDMDRKNEAVVRDSLNRYINPRTGQLQPLFDDIQVHEGIVLRHQESGKNLLILHGHQADWINDRLWWWGKFFVRHFWRYVQLIGIHDPTSPAKNKLKQIRLEKHLTSWVGEHNQMLIAGHTHRPRFPLPGEPPYFNGGSCVHPSRITGIEIQHGEITLIKWTEVADDEGVLRVFREVISGPEKISAFEYLATD